MTIKKEGFIVAAYLHDEGVSLQADEYSPRWTLYVDGNPKGEFAKVSEAATAAVAARTMTI